MRLVSVTRRGVASVLFGIVVASALSQDVYAQNDPLNGAWRLNTARSTYPAGQAPRSATLTYQGTGATKTATNETVDAQGRQSRIVFMHIYDGLPHPTTGTPDIDASVYTRPDANNIIFTRMKEGKLVGIGSGVVSPDGRTLSVTGSGVGGGGLRGSYVLIYDKQ